MLFMGVVVCNTVIGIVQEIRSKKAVDRLSIVVSSDIEVVRNNSIENIQAEEIVVDDIIILSSGIQIPCDCEVVDGFCMLMKACLREKAIRLRKMRETSFSREAMFPPAGFSQR